MTDTYRTCGIICEYNPFHKGHEYQLMKARERTQADIVVCVMSGPFTQRGDAAMFSPGQRARMALKAGADVVVELPAVYTIREAEFFALGGVSILNAMGVSHISFGCENYNLSGLQRAAQLLEEPTAAFLEDLKKGLQAGFSHARAQGEALKTSLGDAYDAMISAPNNVLAICYLRALLRTGSSMMPVPIKRLGAYHDTGWREGFASATAIREALKRGDWSFVKRGVPDSVLPLIQDAMESSRLHRPEALDLLLRERLRTMNAKDLKHYPNVSEGLENRVINLAHRHVTRKGLLEDLKTKRYTYTRLNRLMTHILLGMSQEQISACNPLSFRMLGFSQSARNYLSNLPEGLLYTKAARQEKDASFMLDMTAYDLWCMGAGLPLGEGYRQQVAL